MLWNRKGVFELDLKEKEKFSCHTGEFALSCSMKSKIVAIKVSRRDTSFWWLSFMFSYEF